MELAYMDVNQQMEYWVFLVQIKYTLLFLFTSWLLKELISQQCHIRPKVSLFYFYTMVLIISDFQIS